MVVDMNGIKALFIYMYMPYDCVDYEDEFLLYLGKVNDLIESYYTPYVLLYALCLCNERL